MDTETRQFEVAPVNKSTLAVQTLMFGLTPLTLLVITFVIPEVRDDLWFIIPVALVLAITFIALWFFTGRRQIELTGRRLKIKSTMYTRNVAVDELDLSNARTVDLAEHPELKPMLKLNGYAIPGFQSGHFRSRRWKKMFCLVTAHRVVILPLLDSEAAIMLSPTRPQALLDALLKVKQNQPNDGQAR